MRCLYWSKDCPYSTQLIEIPKEIRDTLPWDRTQMMGSRDYHMPFLVCAKCMREEANTYGVSTWDHGVLLSHAKAFNITYDTTRQLTEVNKDKPLQPILIEDMKQLKKKAEKLSLELETIKAEQQSKESMLKLLLEDQHHTPNDVHRE